MTSFLKSDLFRRYPDLSVCEKQLSMAIELLKHSFDHGGKLIVMGNGGSSADAEHFCGELVKGFVLKRNLPEAACMIYDRVDSELKKYLQVGLPAISLGVAHSLLSAYSNDVNWDYAYAQQIHVLAHSADVVFAISTSGNSKNIVNAIKVAKAKNIKTIALTGLNASMCSELSDITIRVPRVLTHEVQELHLPVYHALAYELEQHYCAK